MMIWKCEEWESCGRWYVNNIHQLSTEYSKWYIPAYILGLTPVDFVLFIKEKYHASHFVFKNDILLFDFPTQQDARNYKNYINKKARERKFVV